jgi:acetyltransferase-like isoleucine patch superfamily enzyme
MRDTQVSLMRRFFSQMDVGKRSLLVLGLLQELVMTAAGLWPAVWLVLRCAPAATTPGHWVLIILAAVLVFDYVYLLALLLLRIVIPRPKEGFYPSRQGGRVHWQAVIYVLNVLLVKARYDPPWSAMFSSVLASVFPLSFLFSRLFGPRTSSATMGDTVFIVDPHLVEIGRNVQLGFHCTMTGHVFDNRGLLIRKIAIGDHAVIGGESKLMAGVQVGHHAVVAARAVVTPNTIIGPYEFWAGSPARKVKDLPQRAQQAAAQPTLNSPQELISSG